MNENGKGRMLRRSLIPLWGLAAVLLCSSVVRAAEGTWSAAGSLAGTRDCHTATLLNNGKVLVAGGYGAIGLLSSCELYDPITNTWSAAGSLASARAIYTATLLPNGKVLVAGGSGNSCELYDPSTNTWSTAGSLASARESHTATLLANGKVLVTGGWNGNYVGTCELYDPSTNTWSTAGNLASARYRHTATLLANGKVLVAGGGGTVGDLNSCELYDPSTNTWSAASSLATARSWHTATLLANGKVLVAGGDSGGGGVFSSCELYDPSKNTWSAAGSLAFARCAHTATLLTNGKVLVAGGVNSHGNNFVGTCELYDPSKNTWTTAGNLAFARHRHTATRLANGKVLVAGGDGDIGPLNSCELYGPNNAPTITSGPSATPSSAYVNDSVSFSVTASDPNSKPLSYSWDFGDGSTGSGSLVSHAFTTAGTYTATVTVSNGTASTTGTVSVTIAVVPAGTPVITSGPTASPNPVNVNNQVLFTAAAGDSDGDDVTLAWDFGDGSSGTGGAVFHTYTAAGTYVAQVTAADPGGKTAVSSVVVVVTESDGGGGGSDTEELTLKRVLVRLNFKKSGRDMILVRGTMDIPTGFSPDGLKVEMDVGGVEKTFTLDEKGRAKTDDTGSKNNRFFVRVRHKKDVLVTGPAPFMAMFIRGDFQTELAAFGLENTTTDKAGEEVTIPVYMTAGDDMNLGFLDGTYKAKLNKRGMVSAKAARDVTP